MSGEIAILGLGPGAPDWLAPAAKTALENADIIVGYPTYLKQIEKLCPKTPRFSTGMRHERARAETAIALAREGKKVAVVSGGDAGIYGMAGLVYELLGENSTEIKTEVLPGISALNAAAALLGAPLMSDFVAISLSDYLVPLETILDRVRLAARGDFVICLYNPKGKQRVEPFNQTCTILLEHLDADRPVGIVRSAYREDQKLWTCRLEELSLQDVNMNCLIIIGNRTTHMIGNKMVSKRGYKIEDDEKRERS